MRIDIWGFRLQKILIHIYIVFSKLCLFFSLAPSLLLWIWGMRNRKFICYGLIQLAITSIPWFLSSLLSRIFPFSVQITSTQWSSLRFLNLYAVSGFFLQYLESVSTNHAGFILKLVLQYGRFSSLTYINTHVVVVEYSIDSPVLCK